MTVMLLGVGVEIGIEIGIGLGLGLISGLGFGRLYSLYPGIKERPSG
jgi:hypothetical protein